MQHRNNWHIWMRWKPRINWNIDESLEMSWTLRKDKLARGERAGKTLDPREKNVINPKKHELSPPKKKRDEELRMRWELHRLKQLPTDWRGSAQLKLMLKTDSGSGKKRVGGRENKDNLEGESTNILKRKHQLKSLRKENKDFARVGWILNYGLRFWDEKGVGGWERKQVRIELNDEEARVDLTRNAPDEKRREPTIGKPIVWS